MPALHETSGREVKVVAFNGSPRKDGNTAVLIGYVLRELEAEGIATELVQLAGQTLAGCRNCGTCARLQDRHCHGHRGDSMNDYIDLMLAADGVIIGSPVYFADVTANTKALIERAGYAARKGGNPLKRKVGAAVVAARRAGALHALDTINHFFAVAEMIVPGSTYWNLGIGQAVGEVEQDDEGVETMQNLGRIMAWLLKRLHA